MNTHTLLDRIEHYWDERSEDFSRHRQQELHGPNAAAWHTLILSHLTEDLQKKPLRVLDIGTGAGFFAILLAKEGHSVTGIDMSHEMLEEAEKNAKAAQCTIDFRKENAQELPFEDDVFDLLLTRNLTWTLPNVMQAYKEWHRVLHKGGMLMNFDSDCGLQTFSKDGDQACVHANIDDAKIRECNTIKDSLRISTHRRPTWDSDYLQTLGFQVQVDENVAPAVHLDNALHYDNVPLFGIYAIK